ncbi:hypothetical protein ACQ4LE_001241 [Meloidogyne hapla]
MTAPTITQMEMLVDSLKIYLNRQIPSELGPTATPNQLRRQLYYTKDSLDRLEKTLNKMDEVSERASHEISKMTQAVKEQREATWQEIKNVNGVRALQEAGKAKYEQWKDKKLELSQRLDLPLELDGSTSEVSEVNTSAQPTPVNKKLQRPQIQLRRFNGNIEEWCSFWETFRVLVHEDPTLSHVEKFNILDSILEDEAKDLLGGLQMTHEGYDTAIDLLLEKFGSERKLVRSLNHELLNLPQSESFEEDEKLYLRIEKLCRQLQSLKQNVDQAPYFMTLEGKISSEVLDKYFTIKDEEDNEDWNTAKFRNALERALTQIRNKVEVKQIPKNVVRDKQEGPTMNFALNYSNPKSNFSPNRVERPRGREEQRDFNSRRQFTGRQQDYSGSSSPTNDQRSPSPTNRQRPPGPTTQRRSSPYPQHNSNSSGSRSPSRFPCQFCDRPHPPTNCRSVRTAEERKNKANERGLCFKCLRKGHYANNCPNPRRRCIFCGRTYHHSALCERQFKDDPKERTVPGVSASTTKIETLTVIERMPNLQINLTGSIQGTVRDQGDTESTMALEPKETPTENSINEIFLIPKRVWSQNNQFTEIKWPYKFEAKANSKITIPKPQINIKETKESLLPLTKILIKKESIPSQMELISNKENYFETTIPVRRKSDNSIQEYGSHHKMRVEAQTTIKKDKKPLEATSPIVFIGNKRALELRDVLKEENLRGMVFEPSSWDSKIFSEQILIKNWTRW